MKFLRWFSKLTVYATLFLIFVGGMVKSTNSGLSVPDWPLSYGMLFPPMVGGVFYEHGHRMVATCVGLFMLILAVVMMFKERRRWLKVLGFISLGAVIFQGILGGITVLYFLPDAVSISHGLLAQTFFVLTIVIAYFYSNEHKKRENENVSYHGNFLKVIILFFAAVFIQLFLGALMRHTESGLAIPDFPKTGGMWWPVFNNDMLYWINDWRFENNLDAVTIKQVISHFIHRVGAVFVVSVLMAVNFIGLKNYGKQTLVYKTILFLDATVFIQVILGITTVLSLKGPSVTSFHVVTGAGILGLTSLLFLRATPLNMNQLKKVLANG